MAANTITGQKLQKPRQRIAREIETPDVQARRLSRQELVDIVEETIRETVNTLNNVGQAVRLTAEVVLEVVALFEKEPVEVSRDASTRGIMAQQIAPEILRRIKEAVEIPR